MDNLELFMVIGRRHFFFWKNGHTRDKDKPYIDKQSNTDELSRNVRSYKTDILSVKCDTKYSILLTR